jgi:hypothetical protein
MCLLGPAAKGGAQTPSTSTGADSPLTGQGRFLVSSALGGSWSRETETRAGTLTRWRLGLSPSVTYFLRDHIGAGLHLGAGISRGAGVDAIRRLVERSAEHVLVGVHGAFDVPIAKRLSLLVWPSLAYVHEWSRDTLDTDGVGATFQQQAMLASQVRRYELGYVRCALSAFLLVHLSSSVGLGLGPELWMDFIVRRVPDFGPGSGRDPDFSQRFPEPRRQRFQVGLSTALVIAL